MSDLIDLDQLERLAAKATSGPWEWEAPMYPGQECYVRGPGRCIAEVDCGDIEQIADDNAAFIAAANPATILALVGELRQALSQRTEAQMNATGWETQAEELRSENARLKEALGGALECAEGLMTDFEGCTDNPSDASRLHEWDGILHERFDWMDDARDALRTASKLTGGADA